LTLLCDEMWVLGESMDQSDDGFKFNFFKDRGRRFRIRTNSHGRTRLQLNKSCNATQSVCNALCELYSLPVGVRTRQVGSGSEDRRPWAKLGRRNLDELLKSDHERPPAKIHDQNATITRGNITHVLVNILRSCCGSGHGLLGRTSPNE
jgi:hypothetical protein